jgi:hypothetical protein
VVAELSSKFFFQRVQTRMKNVRPMEYCTPFKGVKGDFGMNKTSCLSGAFYGLDSGLIQLIYFFSIEMLHQDSQVDSQSNELDLKGSNLFLGCIKNGTYCLPILPGPAKQTIVRQNGCTSETSRQNKCGHQ